ncbi:formyltetrahydrofolate deformylase [uncultured Desulfobacter sp.]|uniref:formyltetrahydrofolate deformylase n=1 Tax=uncultured Desulfobacter sp. TaxID=240139 RepID=UPI002AA74A29|nr:formyltetrahydrofolate deformylase [uncultured Desulfobacter sp.]
MQYLQNKFKLNIVEKKKGGALYILCLNCDDRPGIVGAVATALCNSNCNIEESSQFDDPYSKQFFMRVRFSAVTEKAQEKFRTMFGAVAEKFGMNWSLREMNEMVKTLVLVSKDDHCLNDIIYRWRTKHLNIEIMGVVSNHTVNQALCEQFGLKFYHVPTLGVDKNEIDEQHSRIIAETGTELIVLARYMQILSENMCERYAGRVINIHHSFLPGFKGAKPYHQAYERGVKLIGATAHFVTKNLDEGPIIDQDVMRIDHRDCPKKLQIRGQDTEARVLARAIEMYAERRIFLHGSRTVIL